MWVTWWLVVHWAYDEFEMQVIKTSKVIVLIRVNNFINYVLAVSG